MVREPDCASFWQPLSFICQKMLANSFTYLPIWNSQQWQLLSDYHVAKYLRRGDNNNRSIRLAQTLKDAVDGGLILEDVSIYFPDSPINEILEISKGKPVLIVEQHQVEQLVGIVTPFDLL